MLIKQISNENQLVSEGREEQRAIEEPLQQQGCQEGLCAGNQKGSISIARVQLEKSTAIQQEIKTTGLTEKNDSRPVFKTLSAKSGQHIKPAQRPRQDIQYAKGDHHRWRKRAQRPCAFLPRKTSARVDIK